MRSPSMLQATARYYRRVAFLADARLMDWRLYERVVLAHDVDAETIPEGLSADELRSWLLDFCARTDARAAAIIAETRELVGASLNRHPSEAAIRTQHDAEVARSGHGCSPTCGWCNPDHLEMDR